MHRDFHTVPSSSSQGGPLLMEDIGDGASDAAVWDFHQQQQRQRHKDAAAIASRQPILDICDGDVLLGRGKSNVRHPGNLRFQGKFRFDLCGWQRLDIYIRRRVRPPAETQKHAGVKMS
jgi:hypothetical protein